MALKNTLKQVDFAVSTQHMQAKKKSSVYAITLDNDSDGEAFPILLPRRPHVAQCNGAAGGLCNAAVDDSGALHTQEFQHAQEKDSLVSHSMRSRLYYDNFWDEETQDPRSSDAGVALAAVVRTQTDAAATAKGAQVAKSKKRKSEETHDKTCVVCQKALDFPFQKNADGTTQHLEECKEICSCCGKSVYGHTHVVVDEDSLMCKKCWKK